MGRTKLPKKKKKERIKMDRERFSLANMRRKMFYGRIQSYVSLLIEAWLKWYCRDREGGYSSFINELLLKAYGRWRVESPDEVIEFEKTLPPALLGANHMPSLSAPSPDATISAFVSVLPKAKPGPKRRGQSPPQP